MSYGTIILFIVSFLKLSELSPSWVLNVTEILGEPKQCGTTCWVGRLSRNKQRRSDSCSRLVAREAVGRCWQCTEGLKCGPKSWQVKMDGETIEAQVEERMAGITASYVGKTAFKLLVRGKQHQDDWLLHWGHLVQATSPTWTALGCPCGLWQSLK